MPMDQLNGSTHLGGTLLISMGFMHEPGGWVKASGASLISVGRIVTPYLSHICGRPAGYLLMTVAGDPERR